jgi:hypothetical protein
MTDKAKTEMRDRPDEEVKSPTRVVTIEMAFAGGSVAKSLIENEEFMSKGNAYGELANRIFVAMESSCALRCKGYANQ